MSSNSNRTPAKKRTDPASDTERSKRLNANLIERRRMQNINSGFSSLKKLLPPSDRKQTKAAILQQASQHILRLQRAIIQFKTENDTLRKALDTKTQAMTCTSHHLQFNDKLCKSKPQVMDYDHRGTLAELRPKQYGSRDIEGERPYKNTILPKPLQKKSVDMRSVGRGWKSFEHVKKFEPVFSDNSGFQNFCEVYPHAHAFDSGPPTPPISPGMKECNIVKSRAGSMSVKTLDVSPPFSYSPSNEAKARCSLALAQRAARPPKKNVFNSSTQTAGHAEKRARLSGKSCEGGACQDVTRTKGKSQGDLQYIIEAINIIESKK